MNFGHGAVGFTFCPIAKSKPEPEYSTVLSAPIALDELSITVLASWAKMAPLTSNSAVKAAMHFFDMLTSPFYGSENATTESVAIAATNCLPLLP